MFPLTTKEPVRFTPALSESKENPPVYLVAVASVYGRADFRSRMAEMGLSSPTDEETRERLIEAILAVVEEDQKQDLISIVEEVGSYQGKPLPEHLDKLYRDLERQIRPQYAPYAELIGARTRFVEMLPILACKCFLKGAENLGFDLTFQHGILSDDSLNQLDRDHLDAIGWKAWMLMEVTQEQEKNSASPSPSPGTPKNSATGDTPRKVVKAGTSAARSTRKTPKTG